MENPNWFSTALYEKAKEEHYKDLMFKDQSYFKITKIEVLL